MKGLLTGFDFFDGASVFHAVRHFSGLVVRALLDTLLVEVVPHTFGELHLQLVDSLLILAGRVLVDCFVELGVDDRRDVLAAILALFSRGFSVTSREISNEDYQTCDCDETPFHVLLPSKFSVFVLSHDPETAATFAMGGCYTYLLPIDGGLAAFFLFGFITV